MAQSYVSNTHNALVPTIHTPADRDLGVMETPRLFLWAGWKEDPCANHSSEKQIETSGVIKVKPIAVEKRVGDR